VKYDLVIIADWSAAQGRKPTPQEDRCWLAWGGEDPESRSVPTYYPTRLEAERAITALLLEHPQASCLIGFDFAIGYAVGTNGQSVLPTGRDLCALLAQHITDDPSGVNNRFEVAAQLNELICQSTGQPHGPYWGCPRELRLPTLPERRPPGETGVPQFRTCERAAQHVTRSRPQSAWKLLGIGSVGSQSLVGLPAVHRLLTHPQLAARTHLWPFDTAPDAPNRITIAEIYPSLFEERSPTYWFRDARQVIDARDAILSMLTAGENPVPQIRHTSAQQEGWILGIPEREMEM
jgi:precorrin-8X/cobalt-precorrin-8 methylmutase